MVPAANTGDAEADRAWLADVLGLDSVDAGGGWLIFALPPAELAAHPASSEGGDVELYLMCDSIETTIRELSDKGVAFDGPVTDERWGRVTKIVLPSGARLGLYEPRHAGPTLAMTWVRVYASGGMFWLSRNRLSGS